MGQEDIQSSTAYKAVERSAATVSTREQFMAALQQHKSPITVAGQFSCFISFNVNMLAVSLENEVIKGGLDSYCKNHNCEFARMVRLQYLIIISGYHLPINEIKELFYGKNKLEPFSQSIIRQNIYYYLCSYQYDIKDKQTVCSILHFNIQDILIEEQRLQE